MGNLLGVCRLNEAGGGESIRDVEVGLNNRIVLETLVRGVKVSCVGERGEEGTALLGC